MTFIIKYYTEYLYFHESDTFSLVFGFMLGWSCITSVMLFEYSSHSHATNKIAKQLKQRFWTEIKLFSGNFVLMPVLASVKVIKRLKKALEMKSIYTGNFWVTLLDHWLPFYLYNQNYSARCFALLNLILFHP